MLSQANTPSFPRYPSSSTHSLSHSTAHSFNLSVSRTFATFLLPEGTNPLPNLKKKCDAFLLNVERLGRRLFLCFLCSGTVFTFSTSSDSSFPSEKISAMNIPNHVIQVLQNHMHCSTGRIIPDKTAPMTVPDITAPMVMYKLTTFNKSLRRPINSPMPCLLHTSAISHTLKLE